MEPPSVQLAGYKGDEYRRRRTEYLRRRFAFLVDEFGCRELPAVDPDEVRFANRTTLVIIRIDYEGVSVGIDRVAAPADERYGAIPLLGVMKVRNSPLLNQISGVAPTIDQFEVCAAALPQCAADLLRGDFSVEADVCQWVVERRQQDAEWWDKITTQAMEAKTAEAFRRKDFGTVVAILEPHRERLSTSQRMKLEYARKQLT